MAKKKTNEVLVVLSAFFLLFLALVWVSSSLDLINDSVPIVGYFDDVILLMIFAYSGVVLYRRFTKRFKDNSAEYSKLWRSGNILKLFGKAKTWYIMFALSFTLWYFFYAIDLVPDVVTAIGYMDDAVVALTFFVIFIKNFGGRK